MRRAPGGRALQLGVKPAEINRESVRAMDADAAASDSRGGKILEDIKRVWRRDFSKNRPSAGDAEEGVAVVQGGRPRAISRRHQPKLRRRHSRSSQEADEVLRGHSYCQHAGFVGLAVRYKTDAERLNENGLRIA